MGLILIILVVLLLVGGLPTWGYHSYGYAPSGIGLIILIFLIFLFFGGHF